MLPLPAGSSEMLALAARRCPVAALSLALSIYACSWTPPSDPETFTVLLEFPPDTLDPRFALSAYSMKACRLVYSSLTTIGDDLKPRPDLAESITMANAATWEVKLKTGVRFHDGSPLEAADVKYTYDSIRDPALGSPYLGFYSRIRTIATPDPKTVVFRLDGPHAPFPGELIMGIVPRSAATLPKDSLARRPVGSGPFAFSSWETDEILVLSRNDDFFGPRPKVKTLTLKTLRDDNTRLLSLVSGDADMFQNAAPPLLAAALSGDKRVRVLHAESILYTYMGINLENPVLANVRVRRAIAHAIDREAIIKHKFSGMARPATGMLAPSHWMYEGDVARYGYDPAKAKRLLDEAGLPDPDGDGPAHRFAVTYRTSTNKFRVGVAKVIAAQLEAVGIGVSLRAYEFGTLFHDIKTGNFDLFTLQWTEPFEPDSYRMIFHSQNVPGAGPDSTGANRGRYRNPALDALLDEGRRELLEEKRKAIYSKVQKVLAQDLPYISLWHEDNIAVMGRNVEGFKIRPNAGFEGLAEVRKAGR
ncbi:MAG: ABC transporter substrate-binding protein [Deltaproteobacteria bacterium]|nr:ABC transporter substrate-binding protein [Deltaproteobacteria bacterium]